MSAAHTEPGNPVVRLRRDTPPDPVTRVRQVVDEHTDRGPYVPRVAAVEVAEWLRRHEPEVLAAWLDMQAEHFLWQMINDRDRSRRGHAMHAGKSAAFRQARDAFAAGETILLRNFLDSPFTIGDGSRRRLADLTTDDLYFVADHYGDRARQNGMREAFIRAIAKKMNGGTVGEHFTEAQLNKMWQNITAA